jgi:cytochrome c peroxidase
MRPGGIVAARAVCVALLFSSHAWADDERPANVPGVADFHRPVLMRRFDKNADGRLNVTERKDLRAAFGGVDVPMLPARAVGYTQLELPEHLDAAELNVSDSTPADNPLTEAGATLGRVLFYDTQLSANNTIACASCHHQQYAFSDPRRLSVGFDGGKTGRNAMGLVNLRFTNLKGGRPGFFWDERAATLEDQVLMPIQDQVEMGMQLPVLEARLGKLPYYPGLFQAAFGSPEVTSQRIAKAVAQFMRTLISFDSKFDRGARGADGEYARDFDNFTAAENLGKSLFIDGVGGVGEIGCAHCHVPPTFGMPKSFNNGLDLHYTDQGLGARELPPNDPFTPSNDGKFKAPSLRNIALTAPYMHDGRFQTLEQVVEHYSAGVHPHPNVGLAFDEAAIVNQQGTSGFGLNMARKSALVAFLKTLTDEKFILDARFSDPFVRLTE